MFDDFVEYRIRYRANGAVEVESISDFDHHLYEIDGVWPNDMDIFPPEW